MKRIYFDIGSAIPQCVLGPEGPIRGTFELRDGEIVAEGETEDLGIRVLYEAADVGRVSLDTLSLGARGPARVSLREELHRARAHQLQHCGLPVVGIDLDELLKSSEQAVLTAARQAIHNRDTPFRVGCSLPRLEAPQVFLDRFAEAFDLATLRFYWGQFEPEKGQCQWQRMEKLVAWCEDHGITTKGHPLMYFHPAGVPSWAAPHFAAMKEAACRHVSEVVEHFRGRIDIWDVINEAHGAANCLNYSDEQLLDLTVATCAAARKANPEALLLVNCTDPWGGLAARTTTHTTMRYCRDILARGADFDALGLQLYVGPGLGGVRDLFEFSRMLDSFGALGKPIHITETGVPSSTAPDVAAGRKVTDLLVNGWWHGPWSEQVQAQWVEQFVLVAASKPFVDAVGWWDLADNGTHFHPHGGLLRPDMSAKPAFSKFMQWKRPR